jgi:hypothetical protein
MVRIARGLVVSALLAASCGGGGMSRGKPPGLRINEVMADDEGGTVIDEFGRIGDWVELVNMGEGAVDLATYTLGDSSHPGAPLPPLLLGPGGTLLLWADGHPERGEAHLDFKISASGDALSLRDAAGAVVDEVTTPAVAPNEAYARIPNGGETWVRCHYATPARGNGERCGPPPPPDLPAELHFAPFTWPGEPTAPGPLAISELALAPARFIEVTNQGPSALALADYVLSLGPLRPGDAPPVTGAGAGTTLTWPVATLGPGARLAVPVPAAAEEPLDADPEGEGVAALFRSADGALLDRVDFMRLPADAALVRATTADGELSAARWQLCTDATPEAATPACTPVPARAAGDRLHGLRTPGDFAALADGATELGSESVKFVVDLQAGDAVHFLGTRRWPLHYTFIRERIYHEPALDRCDPAQDQEFVNGWIDFSIREYFNTNRRFLLGTLVRWPSGLSTVEFAAGDFITGEQMRRAFFAVTARLPEPQAWAVRPQAATVFSDGRDDQILHARDVEGTLPIVDPNAPFRGQTFQPLVAGVAYGVLRFVPGTALETASLGPGVIVVTDDVPNDIPLVGGLVTEAFQTPLAHVAVLSKNRGTPNMALLDARHDPTLAPLFDQLVRLEVSGAGFTIAPTTPEEAAAYWQTRWPPGPLVTPRLDTSVRGPIDLTTRGLADLPSVGAKAAQLGELYQIPTASMRTCASGWPLPATPFAIPVVHGLEHFEASGAAALFESRRATPAFVADPAARAAALSEVRAAIMAHPIDPALLAAVTAEIRARFGAATVRLRSSSNTEDLPGFSGAGLYQSVSAALDDEHRDLETGIKTVWSSLWLARAYDERELAHVDHRAAAIAVLVHEAFPDERANGVAISRNILDPIYGDAYYFNAQAGEASVTNPAPGVSSDEGLYSLGYTPPLTYRGRSSLVAGPVLAPAEVTGLMCALGVIHDHFRAVIDPQGENHWFAVDIEWKRLGPERRLLIKQARPYNFGNAAVPTDCREF